MADYAAGWHKNVSLPEEPGNIVLSGHNNIRGAVFANSIAKRRRRASVLYAGGQEYAYTVDEVLMSRRNSPPRSSASTICVANPGTKIDRRLSPARATTTRIASSSPPGRRSWSAAGAGGATPSKAAKERHQTRHPRC